MIERIGTMAVQLRWMLVVEVWRFKAVVAGRVAVIATAMVIYLITVRPRSPS